MAGENPIGTGDRIAWLGNNMLSSEQSADNLRSIALGMEEAIAKDRKGVSLERPLALLITRALWDLADRVELD